jgi:rhomboid protease GluP
VPLLAAAPLTFALIALNTLMLLVEAARSGQGLLDGLLAPNTDVLCRLGALNSAAIADGHQYWRLFTVMVLHAGLIHWAFNSYALYVLGPLLERVLGWARYLGLYVGAGFLGAAASYGLHHTELGVGASGAIFGLLGALIAFFWRRRNLGSTPLRNLLLVAAFNLVLAASIRGIDNVAHIGGLSGGLLAMGVVDWAALRRDRGLELLGLALPFLVGAVLVAYGGSHLAPGAPICPGA